MLPRLVSDFWTQVTLWAQCPKNLETEEHCHSQVSHVDILGSKLPERMNESKSYDMNPKCISFGLIALKEFLRGRNFSLFLDSTKSGVHL